MIDESDGRFAVSVVPMGMVKGERGEGGSVGKTMISQNLMIVPRHHADVLSNPNAYSRQIVLDIIEMYRFLENTILGVSQPLHSGIEVLIPLGMSDDLISSLWGAYGRMSTQSVDIHA